MFKFLSMASLRDQSQPHRFFTAYAQPVANIIRRFQIGYHIYADDTQLYVSKFNPKSEEDIAAAKLRMTQCIAEIRLWVLANKLKLNDSKTELFLIESSKHANFASHLNFKLEIGGSVIAPSDTVKNIGGIFDDSRSMKSHVNSLCRSINFHLRNLSRIRPFIDRSTCAHAVRSLILSRLDYGNSLIGGLSVTDTQRLQKLQNRAARLIYQVSKRTSATPLIRELHCIGCLSSKELNLRSWWYSIPNLALFFDNLEKKMERSRFQLIMTGMGVSYHQKK